MSPKGQRKKPSGKRKKLLQFNRLEIIQLFVIVAFCAAAYVIWLDFKIRKEFEGKKWSLPARVYASPIEIYEGRSLSRDVIERNLKTVGFEPNDRPSLPGEYAKFADKLVYVSRDFRFWDGEEPSRKILLVFDANTIRQVKDVDTGKNIPLLRLEPELIGKIYPEHNEDRIYISIEKVPALLIESLVAIEDRNYFDHHGIDPKGILRAAMVNLMSADLKQGGSTLTQQLVKNFFLTHERTFRRKFNEIIMSLLLEKHYSKQAILEAYINEIYLGQHGSQGIHGFAMASEYYFSRRLDELRPDQVALLIGLVKGASYYNPRRHPERARQRRDLVIQLMQEQGVLSREEAERALSKPLNVVDTPRWSNAKYPDFLQLVKFQLRENYDQEDLKTEGLRIFTTLMTSYQDVMEKAVNARLERLERDRQLPEKTIQAASIITGTETGEILAMIGGRYEDNTGFNRVLSARRPIGSLVKPGIYLTALSKPDEFSVITPLNDVPVRLKQKDNSEWVPKNYDDTVHGQVPLHTALENSYNLATINLGMTLGIPDVKRYLRRMGIVSAIPSYPSLFLGSLDLSPYEVTQMYQTLASDGFRVPLRAIREVLDRVGQPLQRYEIDVEQSLNNEPVFILNYLLSRVVEEGTARSLAARMPSYLPLAGKTGTSNDLRDSWFAGYGDNLLGVVWVGRDDNKPAGLTGAGGALQIWIDMMKKLPLQPRTMTPPEGIKWVKILNGHPVSQDCAQAEPYPFIAPHIPEELGPCGSLEPAEKPEATTEQDEKPWSLFDLFR